MTPRGKQCAIIVASEARWVADAARVLHAHGYAVASQPDLDYAHLLVAPGELHLILLDPGRLGPTLAARIAPLRRHSAGLVLVVVGECPGEQDAALAAGSTVYLPAFDDQELVRILRSVRGTVRSG